MALPRCAFCSSDGWTHVKKQKSNTSTKICSVNQRHILWNNNTYSCPVCNSHKIKMPIIWKVSHLKNTKKNQIVHSSSQMPRVCTTEAVAGPGQPDCTAHLHVHWRWSSGHTLDSLNLGVPWQSWNFCGYCR